MRYLLIFVTILLATIQSTNACTCATNLPGPLECMKDDRFPLIFIGKVTIITVSDGFILVTFQVFSVVKGVVITTVQVRTAANVASCGFPFEQDKQYIVYCGQDDQKNWITSFCTNTKALEDAKYKDFKLLGIVDIYGHNGCTCRLAS